MAEGQKRSKKPVREVKAQSSKAKALSKPDTEHALSADRRAPTELQTANRPLQTEKMEVHHHPQATALLKVIQKEYHLEDE